jgi:hypothetical protein
MKKILTLAAALMTTVACTAAASSATAHNDGHYREAPLECVIRTEPTSYGTRFEAVALADSDAVGEYEFVLTRIDSGGSSDIVQSGDFDLRAGERAVLGEAELSMGRRARYSARLVLFDGREELCAVERRS